jgi:hypothetical protein
MRLIRPVLIAVTHINASSMIAQFVEELRDHLSSEVFYAGYETYEKLCGADIIGGQMVDPADQMECDATNLQSAFEGYNNEGIIADVFSIWQMRLYSQLLHDRLIDSRSLYIYDDVPRGHEHLERMYHCDYSLMISHDNMDHFMDHEFVRLEILEKVRPGENHRLYTKLPHPLRERWTWGEMRF